MMTIVMMMNWYGDEINANDDGAGDEDADGCDNGTLIMVKAGSASFKLAIPSGLHRFIAFMRKSYSPCCHSPEFEDTQCHTMECPETYSIHEFNSSDSSYNILNQMDVISFSFLDSPMKTPYGSSWTHMIS
ncbi:hypothetical protein PoB_005597300 [Plakobranchus ocellatus]|uniref:Uncharacterized protein n=1 Tax=Plakobranchus ocellatus TaxID=259542 RepID=A0AAV4CC76_9GAST|nr:hypothetical protein PoB_005597300 [Plakobranchus ocellatus]